MRVVKNRQLVESIEKHLKRTLSDRVREAFLAVDRVTLVPEHYEQRPGEWVWVPTGDEAYSNRQLVVQITNGLPSSSSSQPALMAVMIEALDLQPGQSVLEIGTGTGYTAALLGHIVGESGHVTSVDIDAHLVHLVQQRLEEVGARNVVAVAHNGFQGYERHAPYDRILLTAGFKEMKRAWSDQLVEGGIFVGNWLQPVIQPLLRLKKSGNELQGGIIPYSALFMEMHEGVAPAMLKIDWQDYDTVVPHHSIQDEGLRQDLHTPNFLIYMSQKLSTVQIHMRPVLGQIALTFIDTQSKGSITLLDERIIARGNLLEEINRLRKQKIPAGYHISYQGNYLHLSPGIDR